MRVSEFMNAMRRRYPEYMFKRDQEALQQLEARLAEPGVNARYADKLEEITQRYVVANRGLIRVDRDFIGFMSVFEDAMILLVQSLKLKVDDALAGEKDLANEVAATVEGLVARFGMSDSHLAALIDAHCRSKQSVVMAEAAAAARLQQLHDAKSFYEVAVPSAEMSGFVPRVVAVLEQSMANLKRGEKQSWRPSAKEMSDLKGCKIRLIDRMSRGRLGAAAKYKQLAGYLLANLASSLTFPEACTLPQQQELISQWCKRFAAAVSSNAYKDYSTDKTIFARQEYMSRDRLNDLIRNICKVCVDDQGQRLSGQAAFRMESDVVASMLKGLDRLAHYRSHEHSPRPDHVSFKPQ